MEENQARTNWPKHIIQCPSCGERHGRFYACKQRIEIIEIIEKLIEERK